MILLLVRLVDVSFHQNVTVTVLPMWWQYCGWWPLVHTLHCIVMTIRRQCRLCVDTSFGSHEESVHLLNSKQHWGDLLNEMMDEDLILCCINNISSIDYISISIFKLNLQEWAWNFALFKLTISLYLYAIVHRKIASLLIASELNHGNSKNSFSWSVRTNSLRVSLERITRAP